MAFSTGSVSTEGASFRRYKGIAPVYVRGINPTKAELDAFYDRESDRDPVYVDSVEDTTGSSFRRIRIEFLLEVASDVIGSELKNNDGTPIELKSRLSFNIIDRVNVSSRTGKHQVIDEYGRTAWVTPEELATKAIPQWSNGPADISSNYREAYVGEEALTNFVIAYLNIPSPSVFKNGTRTMRPADELKNSRARFDNISKWFTGDVSEVRNAIANQPNNKVKVMFGINTSDDGNRYQRVYNRYFAKSNVSNYSKFQKEIDDMTTAGREPSTSYDSLPLYEEVLSPTDFSSSKETPTTQTPATPWS